MVNIHTIPTAEALSSERSVVVGEFSYPARDDYRDERGAFDESEYADDCAELEFRIREHVASTLSEHGLDMNEVEIRLSEMSPGEIRLYA